MAHFPQPSGDVKYLEAAQEMRASAKQDKAKRFLTLVVWVTIFLSVSLAFATLTAQPIAVVSNNRLVSYLLGALLHLLLGLAFHFYKVSRAHHHHFYRIYLAIGLVLILAIVIVGFLRVALFFQAEATLAQAPAFTDQIIAYALSLFAVILEVAAPMLLGFQVAGAWLNYEKAASLYKYTEDFHKRLVSETDKHYAWIEEGYRLESEIRRLKAYIEQAHKNIRSYRAEDRSKEAAAEKVKLTIYEEKILECETRKSLLSKWFPGEDFDKQVESVLRQHEASKDDSQQSPSTDSDTPNE